MSERLEMIKERYMAVEYDYNLRSEDVEYMLETIERYRDALKMISDETECEQTEIYANSALEDKMISEVQVMSEISEAYLKLAEENKDLIKRNNRLTKRSNKLGADLLKAKNEIRSLGGNWKQFNKANRGEDNSSK